MASWCTRSGTTAHRCARNRLDTHRVQRHGVVVSVDTLEWKRCCLLRCHLAYLPLQEWQHERLTRQQKQGGRRFAAVRKQLGGVAWPGGVENENVVPFRRVRALRRRKVAEGRALDAEDAL